MAGDEKQKKNPEGGKPEKAPKGEGKGEGKGKASGAEKPAGKARKGEEAEVPAGPRVPPRLKVAFDTEVRKKLAEQFGEPNPMAQPALEKIVVNINMGRHLEGTKIPPLVKQTVLETITKITGQKPIVIRARKSVANFKLRAGYESSAMVTLRRDRMWHFLDRLIHLATPRIKDFRGLSTTAFDRQGNYSMGLTEQGVFPEINMAEAQFTHGMHINFRFKRSDPARSRVVLESLGFPFRKEEEKSGGKGVEKKAAASAG